MPDGGDRLQRVDDAGRSTDPRLDPERAPIEALPDRGRIAVVVDPDLGLLGVLAGVGERVGGSSARAADRARPWIRSLVPSKRVQTMYAFPGRTATCGLKAFRLALESVCTELIALILGPRLDPEQHRDASGPPGTDPSNRSQTTNAFPVLSIPTCGSSAS